jgi:hypothetical protein
VIPTALLAKADHDSLIKFEKIIVILRDGSVADQLASCLFQPSFDTLPGLRAEVADVVSEFSP